MLTALRIRNVVLIDQLDIEFRQGLCVLTGETGAGKSILLDALGLALGARSEAALVRKGAAQAQVSAEFEVAGDHPCIEILRHADLLLEDDALVLRRSVSSDGKSRAFINDQPVSIGLLKQVGESLVEIHGQFETQGLLNPAAHREILDEYAFSPPFREGSGEGARRKIISSRLPSPHPSLQGGGFLEKGEGTRSAWDAWKSAENELRRRKDSAAQSRAEESYLRAALEDLDALAAQAGEEEKLSGARERLMHREKIIAALNAADEALSGEHDPARKAWAALDRVAARLGTDGKEAIAALGRASAEIEAAAGFIRAQSAELEENGEDLEAIDDRLHELRAQARKHQCAADELPDVRNKLAGRLNLIERGDEAVDELTAAVAKARKVYEGAAEKASAARKAAAKKLDTLAQKEFAPLKMEKAKFLTSVEALPESEWGPEGWDRVRFLVSTNPGAAPGPLNKIASGGEMARFMLALKVVMAETSAGRSMIFDEADSGIGGAVADAVGERLSRLARSRQVLVVTHSPQVAARADHHYIVKKDGAKDVRTTVIYLEKNAARREEIARMLAGAKITDEARAAAGRLLSDLDASAA